MLEDSRQCVSGRNGEDGETKRRPEDGMQEDENYRGIVVEEKTEIEFKTCVEG
jgi:hypothetical protein